MRLCAAPTSLWRHTERGQPQLPLQLLSANASTTLCQLLTTANGRPIPPTTCRRASSSCFGGQLWLTHPQRHSIKYIRSQKRFKSTSQAPSKRSDRWELVVGLEIHAELNTSTKLFSRAQTSSPDATPNSHVAPFDAALPGSQPQFQTKTLIPAIRAALALGCDVQRSSRFDRKHYFYHDQPAGYQITQYYGTWPSHLLEPGG